MVWSLPSGTCIYCWLSRDLRPPPSSTFSIQAVLSWGRCQWKRHPEIRALPEGHEALPVTVLIVDALWETGSCLTGQGLVLSSSSLSSGEPRLLSLPSSHTATKEAGELERWPASCAPRWRMSHCSRGCHRWAVDKSPITCRLWPSHCLEWQRGDCNDGLASAERRNSRTLG